MSCGVDRRCGLDPALMRLWCRLEATVQFGLLAWEVPHASGVDLKDKKTKKKNIYIYIYIYIYIHTHTYKMEAEKTCPKDAAKNR